MDYLSLFVRKYNISLQPPNSECIDLSSAKEILYPGAHIATSNPNEYFHHGIVIDPNAPDMSIIHFWGPTKSMGRIQRTTLPIFIAGASDRVGKTTRQLYLVKYDDDTREKREETVKIAKQMLEQADDVLYDLATSNCESFAYFCRTGKWESGQVTKIKDLLVTRSIEIYEQIKNADEKNKEQIASLLNAIPIDALSPSERSLYDELCADFEPKPKKSNPDAKYH